MAAVCIISAVIAFFTILFLIPINAVFTVSYSDGLSGAELFIKYISIRIPIIPQEKKVEKEEKEDVDVEEEKSEKKSEKSMVETVTKIYYIIDELKGDIFKILSTLVSRTITIKRFNIDAVIGTEDAMFTGVAIGAAYGTIYNILGVIDHTANMKSFSVNIQPEWSGKIIDVGIYLKISTNIFHLLWLLLLLVILFVKFKKLSANTAEA